MQRGSHGRCGAAVVGHVEGLLVDVDVLMICGDLLGPTIWRVCSHALSEFRNNGKGWLLKRTWGRIMYHAPHGVDDWKKR